MVDKYVGGNFCSSFISSGILLWTCGYHKVKFVSKLSFCDSWSIPVYGCSSQTFTMEGFSQLK
jgi:hypothetical protein